MSSFTAHPTAPAAGSTAQAGDARAAGRAPRDQAATAWSTGLKADEADSGAVTLIQRFGSAANLNINLHCLVLEGVYRRGADGVPEFVAVSTPTDDALQSVLHTIVTRIMKLLARGGLLVEEEGSTYMADNDGDSDEASALRPLQAAACARARGPGLRQAQTVRVDCLCLGSAYRIAFGPRAGQKVLTLQGTMPRDGDFKQTLCADNNGFRLHAAVRCAAEDRQALEQLCRYITRPAPANDRVQTNAAGQVVVRLQAPWYDGTTHLVLRRDTNSPVDCLCHPKGPSCARARPARLSPLEFMQRLAVLVPGPRLHLIRLVSV